ncbi:MarR family winged helix-turn-helix transcriptional regulator [Pollutimonas harenae]|uniref:Winged helix-turn-helix transcriptional regulator n=1 Tax=Pollutimonas harenae TaxID=657015 RepID=A0A853H4M6_9BURK|nr:MarR family winged helix-turn-helix transcriptional regulator [Pollutimonas harenae]NYT86869.1 winged helix-turn-helix transcriptional regulator [Pollutimonas harenae]TEA69414.1 MarR family transcriptional regulator [Pollutimonas harenae]
MIASRKAVGQPKGRPTQDDYQMLAAFRLTLRRYHGFSELAALQEGLKPQQHQALLSIKALSAKTPPSVGDVAEQLLIRPHSAVELINRLGRMGLVKRLKDPDDGRKVRIALTALAEEKLAVLSATHLNELNSLRPLLMKLLRNIQP